MVKIKAFRADQDREECIRYVEGHHKVLEAYGVTKVTSADLSWMEEPYTYIVLVEAQETGEVLGGGRIQLAGGKIPLPIETAIDKMDTRIYDIVKEKAKNGTAEYCGLWNSKKIAGYGIGSVVLMRVGIAILDKLNIGSLFGFCSPATLKNCLKVGYQIIKSIGINGTFYYPKEDLLATALLISDPITLQYAQPDERNKIFNMRENPVQKTIEHGIKGEIEVEYNLEIKSCPEQTKTSGIIKSKI